MTSPAAPPPDEKDWTFVIERGCPDCGFSPDPAPAATGERIRAALPAWEKVLARPDAAVRPAPQVWSPLEYGCHVRDVFGVFSGRLAAMLDTDGARFANWDQDAAAVEGRYWEQAPAVVAAGLASSGASLAEAFDRVPDGAWGHRGFRSDGMEFTVSSFAAYLLHEVVHHLRDASG